MIFQTGKYYVCVGEYILNEAQSKQQKRNQFIEVMKTVGFNDRSRARHSMSITRPSSGWGYDDYDYDYYTGITVPCFVVGHIYKCHINGRLIDEKKNSIDITDDNVDNFVYLDLRIDKITRDFVSKAICLRGGGVRISIEPSHLMDFTVDVYKSLKNIDMFQLWFKVSAAGYGFNVHSMTLMEDEFSIRKAVYNIWKKCRVYSNQCKKIRTALRSTKKCSHLQFDDLYLPYDNNRWI